MHGILCKLFINNGATGISKINTVGKLFLLSQIKDSICCLRRSSSSICSIYTANLNCSYKEDPQKLLRDDLSKIARHRQLLCKDNNKWQRNYFTCVCSRSNQFDAFTETATSSPVPKWNIVRNMTSSSDGKEPEKRENIFTVPNLLSVARIGLAPVIGYLILQSDYKLALMLLGVAGITDLLDGSIARHFKNQSSVFGSMLDPVADKILMSVLTCTLTWVSLLPVQLCALIIGRDIGLILAVAHLRYKTLPAPLTFSRFFDLNLPTVQMKPTQISKYNTMLQLGLVGLCLAAPVFNFLDSYWLHTYWYVVGTTTILSGLSYVVKKEDTFKKL